MARKSKAPANNAEPTTDASAKEGKSPAESNESSDKRPGTAGTEMLLMNNRRQASANFQKAQRAERAYRAKKRSANARSAAREAKAHFKESARHFRLGVANSLGAVRSIPYVFGEWEEGLRAKQEKKSKQRAIAQRKKLEARLARDGGRDGDGGEGEGQDDKAVASS